MKVRLGFVSNSSSSSFCIHTTAYKTVFDLAQNMVLCREWDEDKELFNKIEEQKAKVDPNSNISFCTCNYNTFIVKRDDQYIVQTCNNHPFLEKLNGMNWNFPKVQKDDWNVGFGGYQDDYYNSQDYYESHLKDTVEEFWFPEYEVWGNELEYKNKHECEKHPWATVIETRDREYICRTCFYEEKKNEKI